MGEGGYGGSPNAEAGKMPVVLFQVGPLGYLIHVSITTPVVPALKKTILPRAFYHRSPHENFKPLLDSGFI
jgi:hypothetical protein